MGNYFPFLLPFGFSPLDAVAACACPWPEHPEWPALEAVDVFAEQQAFPWAEAPEQLFASAPAPALAQQAALGALSLPVGTAVTAVCADTKAKPAKVNPNTKRIFFIFLCFVQI